MAERYFMKGSDLTVLINGRAAGGITGVEAQETNSFYDVREFLNDKAVESIKRQSFTVVLTMNVSEEDVFSENAYIEALALVCGDKRSIYSNCRVQSVTNSTQSGGRTVRTVKLYSEERQVV